VLTQKDLPKLDPKIKLTINQRNIWYYYLNHRKKHGDQPCFVPKMPLQSTRAEDYLIALQRLEEKGLIRVDRRADNYTGWIILDPK